jgi:teichuronic acid exporter
LINHDSIISKSISIKEKALNSFFWVFMQQFGNQLISFVVTVVLSRMLQPKEFGLIAMLGVFIGLGNALINSGLTQSLIRTEELDDSDYSTVFYFNLVCSICIYSLIYTLAPIIAGFYNQLVLVNVIRVYCVIFIINAFSTIQLTRLTKIFDFKTQLKASMPSLLMGSIIGITLAINGFGVWCLVWSGVAQSLVMTIQLWISSRWTPSPSFNMVKFQRHFNYGVKIMFSGILDIVFTNLYTIIIGKYFAPTQVGFYNRADSLQMMPVSNVTNIVNKISFPLFATVQHDNERLKTIYKRILEMVVFINTPVLIVMAVLATPLFSFLFTEMWLPSVPYFKILCVSGILYPLHSYNLQILNVKGRSDLFLKLEILKKVFVVVVIFFSLRHGIEGLLYGAVTSSVISFFINTFYSGRFLNYYAMEQIRDLCPIFVAASLAGLVTYLCNLSLINLNSSNLVQLFISSIIGLTSFVLISHRIRLNALSELLLIIKRK